MVILIHLFKILAVCAVAIFGLVCGSPVEEVNPGEENPQEPQEPIKEPEQSPEDNLELPHSEEKIDPPLLSVPISRLRTALGNANKALNG